jgi:hypothetical protein
MLATIHSRTYYFLLYCPKIQTFCMGVKLGLWHLGQHRLRMFETRVPTISAPKWDEVNSVENCITS